MILEAEKKAREFKANPAPAFAVPKEINRSALRQSHLDCSKLSKSGVPNEEAQKPFKARSPRVLRKEPFRPVTEHAHSEPMNVQLRTDRRAQERKEFELKVAEKEDQIACLREWVEMEKKAKEEEEIAKLRRELVHKAQPMPKFKPKPLNEKVSSTLPVTIPKSPRFSIRTRTAPQCNSSIAK